MRLPLRQKARSLCRSAHFQTMKKLKEMAASMQRFGKVSIYEAYLSKDGVYRVRLGAYNSRDEALQILDRVLDYGHADVTIVQG